VPLLSSGRRALAFEAVALVAVIALGAWLRLAGLDRTSLFGDEAVYSGQAAALAGNAAAANNFGVFLAHPVLFQLLLAAGFIGGLPPEGGRILTALFGIAAVGVIWAIGRSVGGPALGLAAALLLAVLAYHAYLSRLVMLDGPAALLVGCSLYAFLRAARAGSGTWLTVSAAALGVAVLMKETSVLVLPAVAIAAIVDPRLRLGLRPWLFAAGAFVAVVVAFFLSVVLGGGIPSTITYLHYQLGRHAQSSFLTYFHLVGPYFGWLFVALAAIGFVAALRAGGDRRIIAVWALVPSVILQAWGLRELQLPMIVVIQVTLLAALGIEAIAGIAAGFLGRRAGGVASPGQMAAAAVGVALLAAVVAVVLPLTLRASSLPDGEPGQSGLREASLWVRDHAGPNDGIFVSTAYKSSVIAFYSDRPAYGFAAARRRDPVYRNSGDVEALVRDGGVKWVVLDRASRAQATAAADDPAPYSRLTRMLDGHANELAYVVSGPSSDRWLAQVYRLTETAGQPSPPAPAAIGPGDGGLVALSYAACLALAAGIVVLARRRLSSA
jgi:hypothetical protein